jgi:CHAD domain-containing protein
VTLQQPTASLAKALEALLQSLDLSCAQLEKRQSAATVHECRVAARQLMAFLQALHQACSVAGAGKAQRRVGDLINCLGAARDADVRLAMLGGSHDTAAEGTLLGAAARAKTKAYEELEETLRSPKWRHQRVLLRDVIYELSDKRKVRNTTLADIALPLRRGVRRFVKRVPKKPLSLRKQHRLRLQVKTMRYLSDQFGLASDPTMVKHMRQLKKLQHRLGARRDRVALIEWIGAQELH